MSTKKIIAMAGSISHQSINKILANYTLSLFSEYDTKLLDLNDYQMPIYSIDYEAANGIPPEAKLWVSHLQSSDLIILSLAEHNGSYTSAFKNTLDWASRHMLKMYENKKMLLMATAPGPRGGLGVLEAAKIRFPIHGAEILDTFILPKFLDNFDVKNMKLLNNFDQELKNKVNQIKEKL